MIEIKIDKKIMQRAIDALGHIEDGAPKAIASALNRAVETARTEATREVRKNYYIKAGDVRATIKLTKASATDLMAMIRSKGSPIALSRFKITPNKRPGKKGTVPVKAKVMKSSSGGPIKGAFVAKMKSGHIGVFRRIGKDSTPISEHYGPSVPQMIGNKDIAEWIEQRTKERFDERLDHEIGRLLKGAGR